MGFEMPPERVRRGSSAPMIAVVVGAVAIVAAALLASATAPPDATTPPDALLPAASRPVAAATDSAGATPGATSGGAPVVVPAPTAPRRIPPVTATACHGLDLPVCRTIVGAAVRRLPADAPPVVSVAAWGSLLCGDARDCSASRLDNGRPLGSAVVGFGPGRGSAWVNVVAPRSCRHPACRPVAWLIRWAG